MKRCKQETPIVYWNKESEFHREVIEEPLSADIRRVGYAILALAQRIRNEGVRKVLAGILDDISREG